MSAQLPPRSYVVARCDEYDTLGREPLEPWVTVATVFGSADAATALAKAVEERDPTDQLDGFMWALTEQRVGRLNVGQVESYRRADDPGAWRVVRLS